MNARILLISKEKTLLRLLKKVLLGKRFHVETATSETESVTRSDRSEFDLAIMILGFEGQDKPESIRSTKQSSFQAFFLTKFESKNGFINLRKTAVYTWHIEREIHFSDFISDVSDLQRLITFQPVRTEPEFALDKIIGVSPEIEKLKQQIRKVSRISTKSVLLYGETGTGKELVAHAIHELSGDGFHSLKTLNCAAIPGNLFESAMFGHQAGAFTGATTTQKGLVEEAHQGTLFLDEIGELDLPHQAKLLRFLENGEYMPVGTTKVKYADVRIIAASNRDLEELVKQKKFRDDLFYRLNCIKLSLPPLCKRTQDIPVLVSHFLDEYSRAHCGVTPQFSESLIELLQNYPWPGNIRELKNAVDKILFWADQEYIDVPDLEPELAEKFLNILPAANISLAEMEKNHIFKCLEQNNWQIEQTASVLGIARQTLRRKLNKFNLDKPE